GGGPRSRCGRREERLPARAALGRQPEPDDLPLQGDAARREHAGAHGFTEPLEVLRVRGAVVDEEIAVHLRDLGVTAVEAAAAGGVDEAPGAPPRRILERRAARALTDGLMRLAVLRHFLHGGEDGGGVAGAALERRLREDE